MIRLVLLKISSLQSNYNGLSVELQSNFFNGYKDKFFLLLIYRFKLN